MNGTNMFLSVGDFAGTGPEDNALPDDALDLALDGDLGRRVYGGRRLRRRARRAPGMVYGRRPRRGVRRDFAAMMKKKKGIGDFGNGTNMFLSVGDFSGVGATDDMLDSAFDLTENDLDGYGMGEFGKLPFYQNMFNYVTDHPLLVGGVALASILGVVGLVMLTKKAKRKPVAAPKPAPSLPAPTA